MNLRGTESNESTWCFDAVIEYDDGHLYLGGSTTPFSEGTDEVIPLHRFERLRQGVHPDFLSALVGLPELPGQEFSHDPRGLPKLVSAFTEDSLGTERRGEQTQMVSWMSFEEIIGRLADRHLDPDELDLGMQLVLNTMEFLASELGRERVRLVFRLSRKV